MERQLEEVITGLLAAGGEVTVISRRCELVAHKRMRWLRIPGPARPFPLAFTWFYLLASVVTALKRQGLVHSTGSLIGNRVDVVTVHFCHLGARRRAGLVRRGRANLAYTINAWLSLVISELTERWSYRRDHVRRFVCVSGGLKRELQLCFPNLSAVVETIPNGVDLEEFRADPRRRADVRRALGVEGGELVAVFVGSEWDGKGLAHAIDAIARRAKWHLAVVGEGNRAQYARRATASGCADRVHFVGKVSEVAGYYDAGDAFVLPTRYETFSLATYEAAASGLPLLVTRVSGVEDILRDGVNGWFIEREPKTIEPRLAALEGDERLRERLGQEARDAARGFDWPYVKSAYLELYRRLAESG